MSSASSAKFMSSVKSTKSLSSGKSTSSAMAAQGLAAQSVIRQWQKLYFVWLVLHICCCCCCCCYYSFLCYVIKPSLSHPTSFTFCPFSCPFHCRGGEEQVSSCVVLVASCRIKPQQLLNSHPSLLEDTMNTSYPSSKASCAATVTKPLTIISLLLATLVLICILKAYDLMASFLEQKLSIHQRDTWTP